MSLSYTTPTKLDSAVSTSTPLQRLVDYDETFNASTKNIKLQGMVVGKLNISTKISIINEMEQQLVLPSLSDIGGLKKQIDELKLLLLTPFEQPSLISSESKISFPNGFLIHGLSGVGKTILAEAMLNELRIYKAIVNEDDVHMEDGQYLSKVLKEIRDNRPSCILINDIDLICPHSKDVPLSDSLSSNSSILKKHFNLISRGFFHSVVIATTNEPSNVDPRLKCIGRFDKEIEVCPPNVIDREAILKTILREVPHNLTDAEIKEISLEAHGRVGADLKV